MISMWALGWLVIFGCTFLACVWWAILLWRDG